MLARAGRDATVLEADGTVGGISKTVEFDGYRFDLGGHRFYTKLEPGPAPLGGDARRRAADPAPAVADLLPRAGSSTIRCAPQDVFRGLGLLESTRCAFSYFYWRRRLRKHEAADVRGLGRAAASAAASTTPSFAPTPRRSGASRARRSRPSGRRSGSRSSASSTRCSGSSACNRGAARTTLIEEFLYPRLGPGQMWEAFADCGRGARDPGRAQPPLRRDPPRRRPRRERRRRDRRRRGRARRSTRVLSSIPLAELVECARPAGARPRSARRRAAALPQPLPGRADDHASPSRSPTTGSTCTIPRTQRGTGAELRRLERRHGAGGRAPASGSSTSASRTTRSGRCPTPTRSRWPTSDLARIGMLDPDAGLQRRQGPRAEGLSDVRPRATARRSPRSAATSSTSRT